MGVAEYNFNIYNSLILAGIVQGFVFGFVFLFSKKYRSAGTLYLAALLVVFSANNLQYYLQDSGIISSATLFTILFIPYQFLGGPLLLFYGLCLLHPQGRLPRRALWLLTPFAIGFIVTTLYKILYFTGQKPGAPGTFFWYVPGMIELLAIVMDMAVVIYLLVRIRKVEKSSRDFSTTVVTPQLRWFRIILWVFFFLSFVWIYNAIMSFVFEVETAYYPLWIAMSIMIYWLGHVGVYKFGIEQERRKIRNFSIEHRSTYTSSKQKNEHIAALEKILIAERRFLDPMLSLDTIAAELNLSKSHLSRIINSELGTGFPDYLNALRVEEAKSYLSNPDFANYTLVAIGLEAGFNSKTTFNTAFKKITSLTPSEYRNSMGVESQKPVA